MNLLLRMAALSCLVLHFPMALGQASSSVETSSTKDLTPAELKRLYLACDQAATTTRMPGADAMRCSVVSEELKHRVFGGDFDQLMVWWRTQRRELDGRALTSETYED